MQMTPVVLSALRTSIVKTKVRKQYYFFNKISNENFIVQATGSTGFL